jgi:7-keto-8-aminopelargonate synthetase-like enzyme
MEGAIPPMPAIIALKKIYGFTLLVDEAHSFMALGSMGKGSFNHWQDAGYECRLSDVDVMTCMASKSVGCTGGFALANGPIASVLRQKAIRSRSRVEPLSTIVMLRILSLLSKPLLVEHRMATLKKKAAYVAGVLSHAGCTILSSLGSAIICFPVGKYTRTE